MVQPDNCDCGPFVSLAIDPILLVEVEVGPELSVADAGHGPFEDGLPNQPESVTRSRGDDLCSWGDTEQGKSEEDTEVSRGDGRR